MSPSLSPTTLASITFRLHASHTQWGDTIALVGNHPNLSSWLSLPFSPSVPPQLQPAPFPCWRITISLPADLDLEYKYVILRAGAAPRWEPGPNRALRTPSAGAEIIVTDGAFGHPSPPTSSAPTNLPQPVNKIPYVPATNESKSDNNSGSTKTSRNKNNPHKTSLSLSTTSTPSTTTIQYRECTAADSLSVPPAIQNLLSLTDRDQMKAPRTATRSTKEHTSKQLPSSPQSELLPILSSAPVATPAVGDELLTLATHPISNCYPRVNSQFNSLSAPSTTLDSQSVLQLESTTTHRPPRSNPPISTSISSQLPFASTSQPSIKPSSPTNLRTVMKTNGTSSNNNAGSTLQLSDVVNLLDIARLHCDAARNAIPRPRAVPSDMPDDNAPTSATTTATTTKPTSITTRAPSVTASSRRDSDVDEEEASAALAAAQAAVDDALADVAMMRSKLCGEGKRSNRISNRSLVTGSNTNRTSNKTISISSMSSESSIVETGKNCNRLPSNYKNRMMLAGTARSQLSLRLQQNTSCTNEDGAGIGILPVTATVAVVVLLGAAAAALCEMARALGIHDAESAVWPRQLGQVLLG